MPFDSARVMQIKRDVDIFLSNADRIAASEATGMGNELSVPAYRKCA